MRLVILMILLSLISSPGLAAWETMSIIDNTCHRDWDNLCGEGNNENGLEIIRVGTREKINRTARGVIKFDLTGFKFDENNRCVLQLYLSSESEYMTNIFYVSQITEDWDTDEMTWCERVNGVKWSVDGVAFDIKRSVSLEIASVYGKKGFGDREGWYQWDVTEIVKNWILAGESNYGFCIWQKPQFSHDRNQELAFISREHSQGSVYGPKLLSYSEELDSNKIKNEEIDKERLRAYIMSLPQDKQMKIIQKFQSIKSEDESKRYALELMAQATDAGFITENARKPVQKHPPSLSIDLKFQDQSADNILSAEESGIMSVKVTNIGLGNAHNVEIKVIPENIIQDLIFKPSKPIDNINAGETVDLVINLDAGINIPTTTVRIMVQAVESKGFDSDPVYLSFITEALKPPSLVVSDIGIDDANSNGKIEAGEVVEVTIRISNLGAGAAKNTSALIIMDGKDLFPVKPLSFELNNLNPGEYKDFVFSFYTNKRYSRQEIPFIVKLDEQSGKFSAEEKRTLAFNKKEQTTREINIAAARKSKNETIIVPPGLLIDVDEKIPNTKMNNPRGIAVVIGNRNYENDVPDVDYAIRDAEIIKDYLVKTMGYKPGNIIFRSDATLADFQSIFGTADNREGILYDFVKPGKSDVFVYYSGHGAPDRDSDNAYILPVNCDPRVVKLNAYPLHLLYSNVSKVKAKSVIIVIDACFSGESDGGMIDDGLSAAVIQLKMKPVSINNNMVVFTSTDNQYPSCWYHDKKHSLFTYFFLKALQGDGDNNRDGQLTVEEIFKYVSDDSEGVPYYSRRLKSFTQRPCLIGENKSKIIIEYR
ncbi:MAG: DNRLRE domain-containing protein [Candidatus Krumholzibacteriota bacterium]|nr:DNRLRE domain-containing protein [Candidatus Krumholzibacteriota bacterium]